MPSIDWQSCKTGKTSRYCNDCDLLLIQDQPTPLDVIKQKAAFTKARVPLIGNVPEGQERDRFITELAKLLRLRKCDFNTHQTLDLILFGNGDAPGLTSEIIKKALKASKRPHR